MRRAGCGCASLGCAVPVVALVILVGAAGIFAGKWGALAAPEVARAPEFGAPPGPAQLADIPPGYLRLYQEAAARFGLDWPVLAAVGKVETNHGRNRNGCAPNWAGARGPMQFLEPTFAEVVRRAGLVDADICDPTDAIPAAAWYLRSNGAPRDWWRALYRYNPTPRYPPLVLRWAARYGYGARVVWPIEGGRITQRFGATGFALEPARCYRGRCYGHFHDGLDIAAPLGTPIGAIAPGRVTLAGRVAGGSVVVIVEHSSALSSLYGHLDPQLPVREGQSVVAGQVVGYVGLTGRTTGPHLHLEVMVRGEPIDPLTVLPRR